MAFIDRFLISPVTETLYETDYVDSDQLRFERTVRKQVALRDIPYPEKHDYTSWNYYYKHGAIYVDASTFYSELTYVRFDAVTELVSDEDRDVVMTLWTYGAVSVYVNGKKVHENTDAVYKPIMKYEFTVHLNSGRNEVYVILQNLGVRDTRNLFGLEVDELDGITVTVPALEDGMDAAEWLDAVYLSEDNLIFPSLRENVELSYDLHSPDFATVPYRYSWNPIKTDAIFKVPEDKVYFLVRVPVGKSVISRRFECAEHLHPTYVKAEDDDENFKLMLKRIASADGLSRGDKFGFYIQCILARKALGIERIEDDAHMLETLDQIERRFDCSDFLISGLIRYMHNYQVSEALNKRIKEVLLDYRYWMTMKGSDAMCFWSENHSLLFYSCAMLVGEMYPDEYFHRADCNGTELSAFGRRLVSEWFDDLEKYGYEEFLSTVYMNITFVSLLNIYDYADEEMSRRAGNVLDLMLRELSLHTFDGAVMAPMGRVYRGVINPADQGVQTLMNIIDRENPTSFGEGWLSYYATSKYRFPEGLLELMHDDQDVSYSTGDALVNLRKRANYCLTSVASPRMDGFERWANVTLEGDTDKYLNTHAFTKSFNERFHGTTFFEPGTFGYQQHMWTASLSNEAIVFANLPGDTYDSSSMRPGYWYGNGVMPAVQQKGDMIGSIYRIPEDYPVKFVHLFLPECKFDSVEYYGDNWIFLSKGEGCMAVWYSRRAVRYDDELSKCELRFCGNDTAFICFAGSVKDHGSFERFKQHVMERSIIYSASSGKLYVDDSLFVEYTESCDRTQYI